MWEEKTPEKITFDASMVNQELIGRITSIGKAGRLEVNTYTMVTADEKLITFLGNTVLDKVLNDEMGSLVKIVYTGDQRSSGGFNVKQFKVFVDREESAEPPAELVSEEEPTSKPKKGK